MKWQFIIRMLPSASGLWNGWVSILGYHGRRLKFSLLLTGVRDRDKTVFTVALKSLLVSGMPKSDLIKAIEDEMERTDAGLRKWEAASTEAKESIEDFSWAPIQDMTDSDSLSTNSRWYDQYQEEFETANHQIECLQSFKSELSRRREQIVSVQQS